MYLTYNGYIQCVFCSDHRWPQTSTRCLQAKGMCWSVVGLLRSKVKGKWPPTSWMMDHPTVSSHGNNRCWGESLLQHHWARTHNVSKWLKTKHAITWIPSEEENVLRLHRSVLDERKMFSFDSHFGPYTRWRTSVFLMSSLSLRLLERCKVCLFKTTPFSLCQKKINAVHKAMFYFILCCFGFFFTWIMNRYSFSSGLIIYFSLNVLCKRSFMKKCEYIRAQISSLLHVY